MTTDLRDSAIYKIAHTEDVEEINDILIEEKDKSFKEGKEEAIKSIIELLNIHSSDCDRSLSKNDLINFRRELKELSEEEKE